jgi:hypothetical protein
MRCEKCASNSQRTFLAELTTCFKEIQNLRREPVYITQDISVCLDCGRTELTFPPAELERLKQGVSEPDSHGRSGLDGSHIS